jgi:uracil phosphoribosyltransferase
MPLHVVDHPVLADRLARLRDADTPPRAFRAGMADCGAFLTWEASRDLATRPAAVLSPMGEAPVRRLAVPSPVLLSVLRAGNGLLEGALRVLPDAAVAHLGLARDHITLRPTEYAFQRPADIGARTVFVLDPMLATGHSAVAALRRVAATGATDVRLVALVAAPEGVAVVLDAFPALPITVAALDSHLDARGYIVPGLGDAGDRLYGTA